MRMSRECSKWQKNLWTISGESGTNPSFICIKTSETIKNPLSIIYIYINMCIYKGTRKNYWFGLTNFLRSAQLSKHQNLFYKGISSTNQVVFITLPMFFCYN